MLPVSPKNRDGFALMEVLVVIILIGLLAGLIIPNMSRGTMGVKIRSTSRDIINIMRLAREDAIREQSIFVVRFDFIEQKIHLCDSFGGSLKEYALDQELLKVESVRIAGMEAQEGDQMDILFYPDGNATEAEVILQVKDGTQRITLHTDPITGIAREVKEKNHGRS